MTVELEDLHPHIRDYLERQRAKSESTYSTRKSDLVNFQRWLHAEGHDLEEVGTWELRMYFENQQVEGYAPKTIKGRWDAVYQLFKHLSGEGAIEDHPLRNDDIERKDFTDPKSREEANAEKITYIEKDEMDKLILNVPNPKLRNRLLLRLMWQTGVRTNEVTRIRLEDIERPGEDGQGERSIEVYDRKTHGTRKVYYQESLDFLIEEWLDGGYRAAYPTAGESEYLFLTRQKEKIHDRHVNRIVKDAAENAGIQSVSMTDKNGNERKRITAHTIRHGHAVFALKSGIDVRRVQKHLGHESLEMTMEYLDVIDEDVRDAYRDNWGR